MTSIGLWKLVASVLLILSAEGSGTSASPALSLTGEPIPGTEGNLLTLSCNRITDDAPPLIGVTWYRNTEASFQTVHGGVFPSNSTAYNEVSGRISVTTNQQIHKVMLHITSSLDDGTVWRCCVDDYDSNNLTIVVDAVLVDTTTANDSLKESGTEHVLIVIGFVGWGVTIILAAAILFLWCRVRSSKRQTTNTSKSDPIHSVLFRETSGSDVNNEYASSDMITWASGSDGTNKYVSPKMITGTADSDVHYEYTRTCVVTKTSGSDLSNEYACSEVITGANGSDGTGTNGSDIHNKYVIPCMIAETIGSGKHYEYTTGGAQCNEDWQYTDSYTLDRPLYTDKGKGDNPYLQPVSDELQTSIDEYITAKFDSTDKTPVTNK